jgi:O-antigen/teichoic acid export membrane protein
MQKAQHEMRESSHQTKIVAAFSGVVWQYSSYFLQALAQFIVLTVLSRLLSANEFGLVGIAMVFVNLSTIFSQLGVGPALVQREQVTSVHITTAFYVSIFMGLILFASLYFAAPLIADFFNDQQLTNILRCIGCVFVLASIGIVAESLLTKQLKFQQIMISNLLSYIIGYALVGIICAKIGLGVWSLVIANLVQNFVRAVTLLIAMPHSFRFQIGLKELRELLRFGAGFTLTRVFNYGATEGDRFVIGKVLSVESVGLYSRAYNLMMVVANQFGATLEKVIFPLMSAYQNDHPRLRQIYVSVSAAVTLITFPIGIILVSFAPEIIRTVLGAGWERAILPFQLLTVSLTFRTSYKMGDAVAKATGFVYQRSIREAIYATSVVVGTYVGSRLGLVGASTAVSLSIMLNFFMSTSMGCRIISLPRSVFLRSQVPGIVAGVFSLALSMGVRFLLGTLGIKGPLLLFAGGGLVGGTLLALLWCNPRVIGRDNRYLVGLLRNYVSEQSWLGRGLLRFT